MYCIATSIHIDNTVQLLNQVHHLLSRSLFKREKHLNFTLSDKVMYLTTVCYGCHNELENLGPFNLSTLINMFVLIYKTCTMLLIVYKYSLPKSFCYIHVHEFQKHFSSNISCYVILAGF